MKIEFNFKPFPENKPTKSGKVIALTKYGSVCTYNYSKKYNFFNVMDYYEEGEAMKCQINDYISAFCELASDIEKALTNLISENEDDKNE